MCKKNIELYSVEENMTQKIQTAIDDLFLSGGGILTLKKGIYKIGGIRLRSNCTLFLESGAVLKGTRNPEDYSILKNDTIEPVNPEYFTDVVWVGVDKRTTNDHITKAASGWNNAIIRILDAENVSIIGEEGSIIDGSDCYDEIGEEHYRGPHGISCHYSKGLTFKGYTIQNTGNWAHLGYTCKDLVYENLTINGGHDGIHVSSCDNIEITECGFYTGDDCVAGFDNYNVHVSNCIINSACSGMRFGGADVLVENCHFYGPAKNFFRGSLSLEDKIQGNPAPTSGRKTMLALFTYYCDFTLNVRRLPRNIVLRNCKVENVERFLHFDFTGTHNWQKNKPLCEISFENIDAVGVEMPINAYGDENDRVTLNLKDCSIVFSKQAECAIRSGNFDLINIQNVMIENVAGALVKTYGGVGEIITENLSGVNCISIASDEPFSSQQI